MKIGDDARVFLQTVPSPIAPISVAGKYRIGKSSLLNHLVSDFSKQPNENPPFGISGGFGVENANITGTKGLLIWPEFYPIKLQDGTQVNVVFIDTEGFGSPD